ncbi:MAG: NUDIX domain-containing protein [Chitinophagaceae bacterium]|nr:NUDIX domain-containing protein [Chitinophagaceae bacterium]
MNEGYIVYFGDRPYYIVSHLWPELYKQTSVAGTIIANHPDAGMITKTIRDMEAPGTKAVIILTNEVALYWKIFKSHFIPVTAGGGVVLNENNEVLFIYRRKTWDLPKGKHDDGETIEECALREVQEETGIQNVSIEKRIGATYHVYAEKGKSILKTTEWFTMRANGEQKPVPQTEEDIEKIVWLDVKNWEEIFANTYPSVKLLLAEVRGELLQP